MVDNVYRVIVLLTDTVLSSSSKDSPIDSDVKLVNKNTLLLSSINGRSVPSYLPPHYYQQLNFDAVGYEDDRHMRAEMNLLLEQMILNNRSGCLLRLTPRRTYNIRLLTHLLVSDLDKLLQRTLCRLESINMEYYDVRKFDMINLFASNQERPRPSSRIMQNTREMFQWLHREYPALRRRGRGDDHINVKFTLYDAAGKELTVSLSLFHIFDCNERSDIANFFSSMPRGKRSKTTLLTDCIKESFDPRQPIYTVVVCELPLDKESTQEMHRFLYLADLAYTGISALQAKLVNQEPVNADDSQLSLQQKTTSGNSINGVFQLVEPAKGFLRRNLDAASLRSLPVDLSHEDYKKLASWYHRIDSKYSEVKLAMERHYNMQFRQKFVKLCKQLNNTNMLSDKSGGDASGALMRNSSKDLSAFASYAAAVEQFRQLEKEVKKCDFSPTLSTYMSIKSFELHNAEEALKELEMSKLRYHKSRV